MVMIAHAKLMSMIPWKKINILLLAALCLMAVITLRKIVSRPSLNIVDSTEQAQAERDPFLITELQDQRFLDQDRLARDIDVLGEIDLSEEEIDRRYEELKYDRIVEALRTHQASDLRRIFLDHVNYELLPAGSQERLRNIAEEEGLADLFDQLHR
jgi:hypothetical protein